MKLKGKMALQTTLIVGCGSDSGGDAIAADEKNEELEL